MTLINLYMSIAEKSLVMVYKKKTTNMELAARKYILYFYFGF